MVAAGPLLAEVDNAIRAVADEKGVRLDVPREGKALLRADPLRVRQVVLNLVNNAVKFTDRGGRVWVDVKQSGTTVEIAVRDTGIGISPADQARIFEPFEQASPGAHSGSGLGLAISRRIVALHGGELCVESAPGQGSTFRLRLPAAETLGRRHPAVAGRGSARATRPSRGTVRTASRRSGAGGGRSK